MKFTEFLLVVSQMREAQCAFYANRTQSNLIRAKAKEREVDLAIRQATEELTAMADTRQEQMQLDDVFDAGIKDTEIRATTQGRPTLSVDERIERRHG